MKKGFTLIELLVVVLIIAILAAVALPQYTKAVDKSRAAEALVNMKALHGAAHRYYLANDAWPTTFSQLDISIGSGCTTNTCVHGKYKFIIQLNSDITAKYNNVADGHSFAMFFTDRADIPILREGDIICWVGSSGEYAGFCRSMGGKTMFTHPNGTAGDFYIIGR
ncbi:type IV pilin protein [Parelusimicrobium proximum]|uniref:type IV pilin protein n=1 Tax=Parelusimicrobium proximum TaxID=3228953 RepID=UPI003D16F064